MKILFWILVIIALAFWIRIGNILLNDLHRLTNYGYGYLTGLTITCLALSVVATWIGVKVYYKNKV